MFKVVCISEPFNSFKGYPKIKKGNIEDEIDETEYSTIKQKELI